VTGLGSVYKDTELQLLQGITMQVAACAAQRHLGQLNACLGQAVRFAGVRCSAALSTAKLLAAVEITLWDATNLSFC
jgi:hypothetical protein